MPALKDLLEGKPLHAPLHPAFVHLPIALFPLSVLLDVASFASHGANPSLVRAAFVALLAGIATALLAAVFGFVDYTDIRADHPARKTATLHLVLNLIAVGLFAVSAGLRFSALDGARTGGVPLVVSLLGLAVLSYSGYLGGDLVYNDGIAVGRHRRRTRTPESTVARTNEGGFTAVADATALAQGETLRVDLGGTVIAVARVKEGIFAFQEFCPHRYGPLSEGSLEACEVTCPWHRSRFDIRTGKVTAGPAKIDLRTFSVELRDGKIWVKKDQECMRQR